MILFLEDWKKYPDAIIDYKTSNKSALELSIKLKKMEIKNHSFFLVLFDSTLSGIDPFSPDLTLDHKIRIGIETRKNPFFFS
jgi:hypothetical protein